MSHIFISYSHTDKACVHKLTEALQCEGVDGVYLTNDKNA